MGWWDADAKVWRKDGEQKGRRLGSTTDYQDARGLAARAARAKPAGGGTLTGLAAAGAEAEEKRKRKGKADAMRDIASAAGGAKAPEAPKAPKGSEE